MTINKEYIIPWRIRVGPILLILSSLVGSTNTVNNLQNKKQKNKKIIIKIKQTYSYSHTQHKLKTEHRERVTHKNSFIRQHKIHTLNSSKNVFLSSLYSSTSLS
jgi:hypothetical protein